MMKKPEKLISPFIIVAITILFVYKGLSQNIEREVTPSLLSNKWNAAWITLPGQCPHQYGIFLFRKKFILENKPDEFIINITADNRYKLYVNNHYITTGPSRSDIFHWKFRTVDIAKHLQKGENVIAVEVINFGQEKAHAQFSNQTALIIQGNSQLENIINTEDKTWKVSRSDAHYPHHVQWTNQEDIIGGFYAGNPCDSINGNLYPWNWRTIDFDDSKWTVASWVENGVTRGGRQGKWLLEPEIVPVIHTEKERIHNIIRHSNPEKLEEGFLQEIKPQVIPKNSHYTILLDQGYLTIGFPEIVISYGKNAKIEVTYSEALYDEQGKKGNRNEYEGKGIIGYSDIYVSDGEVNRSYKPNWLRAYRFIELDIKTDDEALEIHDFYNNFHAYPMKREAHFECDDDALNKIWEAAWRTNRLCAQDYLMSDAYYEQMQYIGDARVQGLVTTIMSGDDFLWRKAIEEFNLSRMPEGLTLACYPNDFFLVIPTYSLVWIYMIHDYYMYSGDLEFVKQFLPGIQAVLFWFENRLNKNGLLGPLEWWNFTDWYPQPLNSEPPGSKEGNSALISLMYVYSLQLAAELFEMMDYKEESAQQLYLAQKIQKAVNKLCYDKGLNIYRETPDSELHTQHTNIFAILTSTVESEKHDALMEEIITNEEFLQTSIYYKFYLFRALEKTALRERYLSQLYSWHNMILDGLTTFAEEYDHGTPRSECHPWSTHPAFDFLRLICGIRPMEPGYKKIMIDPELTGLYHVNAKMPIKQGIIELEYAIDSISGDINAVIDLPRGIDGYFKWKGKLNSLRSGKNHIEKQ